MASKTVNTRNVGFRHIEEAIKKLPEINPNSRESTHLECAHFAFSKALDSYMQALVDCKRGLEDDWTEKERAEVNELIGMLYLKLTQLRF